MTEASEFDRGRATGRSDERLDEHDRRLDRINGSIVDNTREVQGMRGDFVTSLADLQLTVQLLIARIDANQLTVATTAEAVEKERGATAQAVEKQQKSKADALVSERAASDRRWSPMTRLLAIIGGIAAAVGVAVAIYSAAHP